MGRSRVVLSLILLSVTAALDAQPALAEPVPAAPAIVRGNIWHLRNTLTSGVADTSFAYGSASDSYRTMGDWNGDGVKTPAVRRGNVWHLRNANSSGFADLTFAYGSKSDYPVVGDWDGDGTDTIGIVRFGFDFVRCGGGRYLVWHLRNSNTAGFADETAIFGCQASLPVVGDWDGDGDDTPGTRSHEWSLNNDLDETPDVVFQFGGLAYTPIVGDWDGDETETVGAVNGDTWYLLNEHVTATSADASFRYGYGTDWKLVWGDAV